MKFPNNDDGQALKMLYKEGIDFNEPHYLELFVAVPDEKNGKATLDILNKQGFNCELEQDEETREWTCYCTKKMIISYDDIINVQQQLEDLCKPYGGYPDGWGVMVD
ncbi:ribonuclease E inhibitor RraB [Cytobacillus sp. Sa5YUA1]|uniref:Ribonuclease E inhibitor RraB n=1 Tax=Cytobacillus stercorigallinarum TaxID=2762240 RepID=A0ABR8QSM8_9BACI|nr:ribonuclease E inhibitor RraB [Cytobacillus stercorigallinarum]MBD7938540.1 ribonuclease E inhibitor RraB [Cytobacillus stercorigallinarum]